MATTRGRPRLRPAPLSFTPPLNSAVASRPSGRPRRWPVEAPRSIEASRGHRRFPSGRWGSAGTVEARMEHECALAGAGDRGAPVEVLMSDPRVRRRRAAEGRMGAPLGQACKSVGRGRNHLSHCRSPSLRLDGSRSTARRSRAISVQERLAHHGRQGPGATSTRLLATTATILHTLANIRCHLPALWA